MTERNDFVIIPEDMSLNELAQAYRMAPGASATDRMIASHLDAASALLPEHLT